MSLHPGADHYNPAGNSDFTRKAEALALGIVRWSTPKAKGGPGQSYGSGGMPPLPAQAAQWPTPAAQNWKGSSEASVVRADGKSRMDILHYRAVSRAVCRSTSSATGTVIAPSVLWSGRNGFSSGANGGR
jgi:hypothetical protein